MNILITGASRGIGYELTKLFCDQPGDDIFIVSRSEEKLKTLTDECRKIQPYSRIIPLAGDVSDTQFLSRIVETITNESGSLDILINNAGQLFNRPFGEISAHEIDLTFKVNIISPIKLIQASLPLLLKAPNAHVVNISSMGGFQGSVKFSGLATYSSSKAALACLTECLAEEFKDTTVKFNCLALGAVATEMLAEAFPVYQAKVSALEMAKYIYHFAINGYHFFNGKIIPVSISTP
jgi:short-subunit dehydrogenase